MNVQARIDYLTEMRESALYEASCSQNSHHVGLEFSSVAHWLEQTIVTLKYIQTLQKHED